MRRILQKAPVQAAIMSNRETIGRVVNTGIAFKQPKFPPQELPRLLIYAPGDNPLSLTHFVVATYGIGAEGKRVPVKPKLSIRLQVGHAATAGIVATVYYREFKIPRDQQSASAPRVNRLLVAEFFDLHKGDCFAAEEIIDARRRVGGPGDHGYLALLTAHAIDATAEVFYGLSQEELNQMSRPAG